MYSNKTNSWTKYSSEIKPEDTTGKHIISFHGDGGSGYMKELLYEGETYTLPVCGLIPPEPKEVFSAWNVGGTEYQPGETITVPGDMIISAVWKSKSGDTENGSGSGWSEDKNKGEHTAHNYSSDWNKDAANHWKECVCGDKSEVAAHSFKWVIDEAATTTNTGRKHEECSVCNYTKEAVTIPELTPKKGDRIKDGRKNEYVVTDAKKKTVTFRKVGNINAETFTIPATVTINKVTYKVTEIGDNAFKNNKVITKISIGSNVTKIGRNAFSGCKSLKAIIVKSTKLKSVGKNALKEIYAKAKIKVPKSKLTKYKTLFKNKGQSKKVKVTQ